MSEISREKWSEWMFKNKVLTGLIYRYGDGAKYLLGRIKEAMQEVIDKGECEMYLDMAEGRTRVNIPIDTFLGYCLGIAYIDPNTFDVD